MARSTARAAAATGGQRRRVIVSARGAATSPTTSTRWTASTGTRGVGIQCVASGMIDYLIIYLFGGWGEFIPLNAKHI